MNDPFSDNSDLGVYCADTKGDWSVVHHYDEGDYGLEDIPEQFQLGKLTAPEEEAVTVLELSFEQLRKLKVLADARSFDYEAGFIEMCLDMYRFGHNQSQPQYRFLGNF